MHPLTVPLTDLCVYDVSVSCRQLRYPEAAATCSPAPRFRSCCVHNTCNYPPPTSRCVDPPLIGQKNNGASFALPPRPALHHMLKQPAVASCTLTQVALLEPHKLPYIRFIGQHFITCSSNCGWLYITQVALLEPHK